MMKGAMVTPWHYALSWPYIGDSFTKVSNVEIWCHIVSLEELLNKQSSSRWFRTLWGPYDVTVLFFDAHEWILVHGPLLLTWFNFNPNMDK